MRSPIDGRPLGEVETATPAEAEAVIAEAADAFEAWRVVPAPVRGRFVRAVAERLRHHQEDLAAVVSWEAGKTTAEAFGEVQEMIDIADFAVGLSRQLYGLTMPSERPGHRMMEQWHPLGVVGVVSAFNFPVAVWAWNAMLAWVCGDTVVWKPSEKTPLCAVACQRIVAEVLEEMPGVPPGVSGVVAGGAEVGEAMARSRTVALVSATGSTAMGRKVAAVVAERLGRCLLELGGNNAMIVTPSADLGLAVRAIVFAAVGTAGQRCTTLRRLIVHETIRGEVIRRLTAVYGRLPIGDPTRDGVLVGPLIDERAYGAMRAALSSVVEQGGRVVTGGERVTKGVPDGGVYVTPALAEVPAGAPILQDETFAPLLLVCGYDTLDGAIRLHNDVPQGLSSAIFTGDQREAEVFLSAAGSDCGIANVNIGTSGAEIGGAFGGEKDTGGGRESGSDAWKSYMRRVTTTINYSGELPLAQGIRFEL